jgi:hypothetical protein
MASYSLVVAIDVSEEHYASEFMVEEYLYETWLPLYQTAWCHNPEQGS